MSDAIGNAVSPLRPLAGWALRIAFGLTFVYYGYLKATGLSGFADAMLGGSTFLAALVTFAELAGGIGIIVGAFTSSLVTRLAGLAIIPVMLGAIFMVHIGNGFHFMNGGYNFQLVLLLIAVYFVIVGNGDET